MSSERWHVATLIKHCTDLLIAASARGDMAHAVADVLVEGELLGHDTHGVALLFPYANELLSGGMKGSGDWVVAKSTVVSALWDGQRLPGPWLVTNAIAAATNMARAYGTGTISVGNAHHIACLAAYLRAPAADGLLVTLQCSDPSAAGVAPFGGTTALLTPNPIAAGIPAEPHPILVDVSASITTLGMAKRVASTGGRMRGKWLIDAKGSPTDDPAVLDQSPPGTLLPLGGVESGHKGFGLGLMIDAMTGSLSGHGRSDKPSKWGASFLVMVIDPEHFSGREKFVADTSHVATTARQSPPVDTAKPVRLPGDRGLALRAAALRDGLLLSPAAEKSLGDLEQRLGATRPNQNV